MTSGGNHQPAYGEWMLVIVRAQACMKAEHGLFERINMGAICVTVAMSVPSQSYPIIYRYDRSELEGCSVTIFYLSNFARR